LGDIGDGRAVEPLIWVLSDDDWGFSEAAKEALEKLGHEEE
jgi:HEAT repeat protein